MPGPAPDCLPTMRRRTRQRWSTRVLRQGPRLRATEPRPRAAHGPPGAVRAYEEQSETWNSPVLPWCITRVQVSRDRRALHRIHPKPEIVDPLEQVILDAWIHGFVATQETKVLPAQLLMLMVCLAHDAPRWFTGNARWTRTDTAIPAPSAAPSHARIENPDARPIVLAQHPAIPPTPIAIETRWRAHAARQPVAESGTEDRLT